MLIFDIETRPLPLDRLKQVVPPFASQLQHPGEFDPGSVKIGNIKDPEKIDAKIELAKREHESRAAKFADDVVEEESRYWSDIQSKAALEAELATVCAIGYTNPGGKIAIDLDLEMPEEQIIRRFWQKYESCRSASPVRNIVGYNSHRFDIPFLVRRSWNLDIQVPPGVFTPTGYVGHVFVDLLDRWQCGDRRAYVKLDKLCRANGLPGKPDDCTGALFHELVSNESTRSAAIGYLENDLVMTLGLARKLQLI